jgi:hypothetical protein
VPDDEDAIAATLRTVSEDGVVGFDAVDDAIADTSMYLSTAEGRVELAGVTFRETREAIRGVAEIEFVETRLDEFERRVNALEGEATALAEDLQAQVERREDPGQVYETARELARIKTAADDLQARADLLKSDVEEFEAMVDDPERGFVELIGDLNALDGFVADLEATIEELVGVRDGEIGTDTETYDPARIWFETTVRHRLNGLVFDDVRAELDSIRTVAGERGITEFDRDSDVEARLSEVCDRWKEVGEELDAIAPPEWHGEYDDRIDDIEARTADAEPPIDWDAVEADLGEYLSGE